MSVCGNCPYPYEYILENPGVTEEEVCRMGCSHEDGGCLYGKCMTDYKGIETTYPKNYSNKIYYVFDWFDERRNKW